jgi:hypothetical protein
VSELLRSLIGRNAERLALAADVQDPMMKSALVHLVAYDLDEVRGHIVTELHAWEREQEQQRKREAAKTAK